MRRKIKKNYIERGVMQIPINSLHPHKQCTRRYYIDPGFCFMYRKMQHRQTNTFYLIQCM